LHPNARRSAYSSRASRRRARRARDGALLDAAPLDFVLRGGGLALLCAGCIALPWRLAAYREAIDKLKFLRDGYTRCVSHRDEELAKMLDERFYRLI